MLKSDDAATGGIDFARQGRAGIITLSRPEALNALNQPMVEAMAARLAEWREDETVGLVIIRGEGRAFCAGGDIRAVYEAGRAGHRAIDFFTHEYRLNAAIAAFPKPYVALIDGLAMGGGLGVSVHGSHRVVTQNAVMAMPEASIGFFPDVGGSFFLSRLPGCYGMYMALTGARVSCGEALGLGLATHAVEADDLDGVADEIAATGDVEAVLAECCRQVPRDSDAATLHHVERHFSLGTLGDCIESLRRAAGREDAFARATLDTLAKQSPTSLHVAFRQVSLGAMLSMEECMRMEYRIVARMLDNPDFYEGIRARLVDKTGAPSWQPPTIDAVDPAAIDAFFAPLPGGELDL